MISNPSPENMLSLEVIYRDGIRIFKPKGFWGYKFAERGEQLVRDILKEEKKKGLPPQQSILDLNHVDHLDTTGAWLLASLGQGQEKYIKNFSLRAGSPSMHALLESACEFQSRKKSDEKQNAFFLHFLDHIGRSVVGGLRSFWGSLGFLGEFLVAFVRSLLQPGRVRWVSVVSLIEEIGLNAFPIVMILSFFIGAVIAFMGSTLLQTFGASVFVVELVGFSVLREFAPLITMILLAGRSDSAFAAQIGAMRMRQEISALQVMGLDPFDVLVIPRALACLVAAPILTFGAMIAGILGGVLSAWATMDINPSFFFVRLRDSVPPVHLWVGLAKTPVFALVIAVIGCRQGLSVEGDVMSLGRKTTSAVVEAIFSVVVIDAIFAIIYMELGL